MTTMADIVLVFAKTGMDFGATISVPHALLSVAAPLQKAGYKVKIIDQRVNMQWEMELLKSLESSPIYVGLSVMTGTTIHHALTASKIVKSYKEGLIPVVWGGPHPTILPEQTLANENIDICCIGEGDVTAVELADALSRKSPLSEVKGIIYKTSGRLIKTEERPFIDVEKLLPVPWDLINVHEYFTRDFYMQKTSRTLDIGQTSRGCPYMCGFCSSAAIRKRKWRPMSAEKSLFHILEPIKRFNLDAIWIRDDEFYIDRNRASTICKGIIDSKLKFKWYTSGTRVDVFNRASDDEVALLKRSGADTLKFGAESGSDRILSLMKKGITIEQTLKANQQVKKHGIIPVFALMIGFPTETFEEIEQTIDFRYRLKKENPAAQFETMAIYTALPATEMWDLSLSSGLKAPKTLEDWIPWVFDDFDCEGTRSPWFNYRDRIRLGNITYMSMLSNAVVNAANSLKSPLLRAVMKGVLSISAKYYNFMLKHKFYKFAPELRMLKILRKKIFYKSKFTFH